MGSILTSKDCVLASKDCVLASKDCVLASKEYYRRRPLSLLPYLLTKVSNLLPNESRVLTKLF